MQNQLVYPEYQYPSSQNQTHTQVQLPTGNSYPHGAIRQPSHLPPNKVPKETSHASYQQATPVPPNYNSGDYHRYTKPATQQQSTPHRTRRQLYRSQSHIQQVHKHPQKTWKSDRSLAIEGVWEPPYSISPRKKNHLYKTEMCKRITQLGHCSYGSRCAFAHSLSEIQPKAVHPLFKTRPCIIYTQVGTCPFGDRCRFIHDPDLIQSQTRYHHKNQRNVPHKYIPHVSQQHPVNPNVYTSSESHLPVVQSISPSAAHSVSPDFQSTPPSPMPQSHSSGHVIYNNTTIRAHQSQRVLKRAAISQPSIGTYIPSSPGPHILYQQPETPGAPEYVNQHNLIKSQSLNTLPRPPITLSPSSPIPSTSPLDSPPEYAPPGKVSSSSVSHQVFHPSTLSSEFNSLEISSNLSDTSQHSESSS